MENMVDIYKPGEAGFSHYNHIWRDLQHGENRFIYSDEPSIIVAIDTSLYLDIIPRLLEIEGIVFKAEKEVLFTDNDVRKIRNDINQIYARKMDIPVRSLRGVQPDIALGIFSGYDTREFNPKGLKVHQLLDADMRGFYRADEEGLVGLLSIANFSDPEDDRRLSENHHYIAAVADLYNPYNWKSINEMSPKVEKIIEILTGETQETP